MSNLFQERIEYKPFEYPEYYTEGWLKQAQAFWLHTEISMQGDVKDWNEKLTGPEKNLVGNILLGFAQTECAVSDYWTGMVTKWFPKWEIKQMAMMFGSQETIHATAYSYLNETLGLEDFAAFLHEPATAEKFEHLTETQADWTHEDLQTNPVARREVARSLAIFSAFAEGVSLYSSFAVLYSFQMRNLLKGIGQQMKWSVRDESLHSKMGCQLFNQMCAEYPELKQEVAADVKTAAQLMMEMEHKFIDMIFEQGDLENLKADDLKEFITKRTNEKLNELGYETQFDFNAEQAGELDWFYHLTGGHTHTDFFAVRPTDYAKAGEDENWDEDELF
ncbi:ribonucleotide-diphosphate reductase subunit beta [bacterium]|mgnify:FL=1|jgi:ribonucleoside-diphosphate reductase beta chain|nr:ribonucleotide-diphosphate reductase subunit beta [bacterium]MDB9899999.1 ribonucleotide-diphosphate reductase subunit beta [bacterium]|tara:strand:- start:1046 stop:2047 length:1002 start_codon:yes stop_codon:yes gene_type:complete